ncbi:MAG: rhodanese-like domain-containing protein [Gammaproteobacteria bacterium]|nr:rhodanese-like domain-containing protein [Gammaproteobacteria bacterium]
MATDIAVKELDPEEAQALLHNEPAGILVDIRSHMEYLFIGHPAGCVHIPWIDEPDWKINPNFIRELRQLVLGGLSHDSATVNDVPIVLICRSGKRSLEAGARLIEDGFHRVYSVRHGFEGELDDNHHRSTLSGWRFDGLPWEQC